MYASDLTGRCVLLESGYCITLGAVSAKLGRAK
jgi:hypothetical protein